MEKYLFGRTGLEVSRSGFGALPIQRVDFNEADIIIKRALEGGINYFDTARFYTDSEKKLGKSLGQERKNVIIATKSMSETSEILNQHLEISLKELKTDYIDVYQFHCAPVMPKPGDESGLYEAMLKAKKEGKIRFIGITAHRLEVALEAAKSNLYDTIQFTLNYLSPPQDLPLVDLCKENNIGLAAMKPVSGGILTSMAGAFAFLRSHDNILPLWGIQKLSELEEFLQYEDNPPQLNSKLLKIIAADKKELGSIFCRGCGYCLPCPVGIEINNAARMMILLKRALVETFTTIEWQEKMDLIDECLECGDCREKCPYELDTPNLLKKNLIFFRQYLIDNKIKVKD